MRLRIGITTKLLVWSLALIMLFYIITFYLFWGIRDVVATSEQIVTRDFAMMERSDQVVDTLLSYLGNIRKYEILGREEYLLASREYLTSLNFMLERFIVQQGDQSPGVSFLRADLANYLHNANHDALPDEERTGLWIALVSRDRLNHFERINEHVQDMYTRGAEAEHWGFFGLAAVTFFGVAASLGIALRLNRSLREIRLGIKRMTNEEEFLPIQVKSSDELGDLARSFNEMAQRLDTEARMRADFISMLSHEIHTPLTSVREAISLVQDGVLGAVDQRQTACLDIAQKEARRLSDLLSKLMQISNLGPSRIELHFQVLSILDLVHEAIQRIRPIALKRGITTAEPTVTSTVWVFADRDHMQQVLFNLLGNALKFAPQGSRVTIKISVQKTSNMVKICISDQGPGIPPDEQKYVFQRYYRGNESKTITDGAGLGLSISKQIIEAHTGKIWLEESSSAGSVFCFTLPLAHNQPLEHTA